MMRFNKHLFCTILFAFILGIGMVNAQVRVVNEDGDVIILLSDGTWRYEDDEKENKRIDKKSPPPQNVVPVSTTKPNKKEKTTTVTGVENKKKASSKENTKKPTTKKEVAPKNKVEQQPKEPVKKTNTTKTGEPTPVKTAEVAKPKPNKQKATVYPVPVRERKIKSPVIEEQICEYSMKERDEFTNKFKVATKPQSFFTYTQKDLQKFMRDKDYLVCTGYLSRVMGMTILNLKFEIESTMAQQEYGEILEGTQILVKLLDGSTVTLTCQEADSGTVNENTGKTIYRSHFTIDKTDAKVLSKSEVVKVRMLWSTGYEDYDVNELDFFINQLKCLDQVTY